MSGRMNADEALEEIFMSLDDFDFEESEEEDITDDGPEYLPENGRGVITSAEVEEEEEKEVMEESSDTLSQKKATTFGRARSRRNQSNPQPFGEWKKEQISRRGSWYELEPEVHDRDLSSNPTVLSAFLSVFPEEVFALMVDMTNKNYYRKAAMREEKRREREGTTCRPRSHVAPFTDVTIDEMKAFVGLNIAMGVMKLPRIVSYWRNTKSFCLAPYFGLTMTRDRFQVIYRHLHFSEPPPKTTQPVEEPDKLRKIRTFIEILRKRFLKAYVPGREISIDESMIPFKGRLSWLQYLPAKRTRFGMKVFVLAEPTTGYMSNFSIYVGSAKRDPEYEQLSVSGQIVFDLLQPYLGEGRHIYMDNYYTSPMLLQELYKKNTFCCGTVRSSQKGFPKDLIFNATGRGKKERGWMDWRTAKSVLCYSWNDNKAVYVMSTIHHPEPEGTEPMLVKRRKKDRNATGLVPCPSVIKDYNNYMRGVDFCDQLRKYYNITRKSRIWYKKVYGYFLECAVQNARTIYQTATKKKVDPIKFREDLVDGLVGECKSSGRYKFPPRLVQSSELRLDGSLLHLPVSIEGDMQLRCHCCKELSKAATAAGKEEIKIMKSTFKCEACDAPLCLKKERNCFKTWHQQKELTP